jgi:predicted nucleic acid-binding protein
MTLGASVSSIRDTRRALHTLSAKANHRLPFQDVLIAATAAHKNIAVLHYDGHFDILSKVLGFESRCCEHERRRQEGWLMVVPLTAVL